MASVVKKKIHKLPPDHPLSRQFDTVEEAAQAKTDYIWNTVLKNVDWQDFQNEKRKMPNQ